MYTRLLRRHSFYCPNYICVPINMEHLAIFLINNVTVVIHEVKSERMFPLIRLLCKILRKNDRSQRNEDPCTSIEIVFT